MKLTELQLENFQSYDSETIEFTDGVSIIYGKNGTGKSTLLRGIFAALFQTSMKREVSGDINIAGLVNKNSTSGSVQLVFSESDTEYTVSWKISTQSDENGNRTGRTNSCVLESTDGTVSLSGVTDVSNFLTDLLGLDAQAFVNSVYVQQEELTKLLTADSDTRKEIFDTLLGLEQVDTYIERMESARREVKSVRKNVQSQKSEVESQLETEPEIEALTRKKSQLNKTVNSIESDITSLREERDDLQKKAAKLEDTDKDIDTLQEQKQSLNTKIKNKKSEIQTLKTDISTLEDKIEQLQHKTTESPDGDIDTLQSKRQEKQSQYDEYKSRHSELQTTINTNENLISQKSQQIQSQTQEIEKKTEQKKQLEKSVREKRTKLQRIIHKKETAASEVGVTPEITKETVVKQLTELEEEQETLTENIASYQSTISEVQSTLSTKTERKEQLKNQIESLEQKLELPDVFKSHPIKQKTLSEITDEIINSEYVDVETLSVQTAYKLLVNQSQEIGNDIGVKRLTELQTKLLYYTIIQEQSEIQSEISTYQKQIAQLEAEIQTYESKLSDAQFMKRVYKTDKQLLTQKIDKFKSLQQAIESQEQIDFTESVERLNEISSEIEALKEKRNRNINELSQKISETEAARAEDTEVQDTIQTLQSEIDTIERQITEIEEATEAAQRIKTINEKIDSKQSLIENTKEQITQLEADLERTETQINSLSTIDMSLDEVQEQITSIDSTLQSKESSRDSRKSEISQVEDTISRIETLQSRITNFESRIETLTKELEQVQQLIRSYETVKEETRKSYIAKINQYTNEIFRSVYQNDAYENVRIDTNYEITLCKTDGTTIEPSLTSGGESAIVNLALRAGVYRVITESGNTSLPPFILDEPTTFLDTQHVGKLEQLVKTMAEWDIEQVFIVSHNEQLIESGDAVYNVEKENNTSTVTKQL